MINNNLEEITKDDLQDLIDNGELENKTTEYKETLPGDKDENRVEFLADISSFANASGGDIIYGISEDRNTGKPKPLEGLNVENIDQKILALEHIIRDGIKPRIIPAVKTWSVPLPDNKIALVIRIPKSLNSPHGVYYKGKKHGKFYTRASNGKHDMDIQELRVAFNLSETITERIRSFRMDRIAKIIADETPVPLVEGPKIIFQSVPITSFSSNQSYDMSNIASNISMMPPLNHSSGRYRYNLDGLLSFYELKDDEYCSYSQLFRNGILEGVDCELFRYLDAEHKIPSYSFEERLISSTKTYLNLYKTLMIELPIFIFITILGVKGYSLAVNPSLWLMKSYKIDRDVLQLPEVMVENLHINTTELLKPSFDSFWNACGYSGSNNYNENGEWAPR
jgi:hypothetical protein